MGTQRQDDSAKKPPSAGVKRSDAIWGMIVPSTHLGKSRPRPTIGLRSAYSPIIHAEELTSTHPVARKEKARHEPGIRAQLAHSYISPTESLERVPSVQSDRRFDYDMPSEDKVLALIAAPESVDSDEEPSEESDNTEDLSGEGELNEDSNETASEGSDNTEGSDGDGECHEDSNEKASDTSGSSTRKLQSSHRTSRSGSTNVRGRLRELTKPRRIIARKRNVSPQPASTNDKRPRKRHRFVVEESEDDIDEEEGEEEEDNDEALCAPHHINRSPKKCAQTQQLPSLATVPPLSRYSWAWTNDQEETLCRLRNEGKDWEYIGERVLGRTALGVRRHWEKMRSESLKPVGKRNKGRLRRQNHPLVSMMAKIPHKRKQWSKEEEELLSSLHARGMTLKYASRQMQGRGYNACKARWRRIKDSHPSAISASKLARMDGERIPSDSQDAHPFNTSQLEQEADDAGFESQSATLESDDLKSSTNGDSLVTVGKDNLPPNQAVVIHRNFVSADESKRPQYKAPPTEHQDQQAADPTSVGEAFTPGTKGSLIANQPGMRFFNAGRDSETQNELSFSKDLLLREPISLNNERGMPETGKHRRSNSWPC